MKTPFQRGLKVPRVEEERLVNPGEIILRVGPAEPRKVLTWDDHLATAAPGRGKTAADTVLEDREGR